MTALIGIGLLGAGCEMVFRDFLWINDQRRLEKWERRQRIYEVASGGFVILVGVLMMLGLVG